MPALLYFNKIKSGYRKSCQSTISKSTHASKRSAQVQRKEKRRKKRRANLRKIFWLLFNSELDALRSKVDSAKAADANIRCAVPFG